MSKHLSKAMISLFKKLGKNDQDLICAELQKQIMRERNTEFLSLFRGKKENDLMNLALFIKETNHE